MDFRSQDEDIGMPSSLGYNNPPPIRGSAFSKPSTSPSSSSSLLSPLLSPRGAAPGHRNGSAFGNTQQPPPAPPLNPRIDPDPSRSLGKNPDPAAIPTASPSSSSGKTLAPAVESAALYCECLRNHAASIGGHVVDGCGEFMPFGDAGTPDALKCAACGCHRSFHRKDVGGNPSAGSPYYRGAPRLPLLLPPPHPQAHHHKRPYPMGFPPSPSQAAPGSYSAAMAFGGNASGSGGTTTESSSEERMTAGEPPPVVVLKKRFRTKFTAEQKERMLAFAESVGWRFHKQDEALVQQFCAEVGVRRQVLKVWMHNNKHTIRRQQQQQQQQQHQQEQQHPPQHQQQL